MIAVTPCILKRCSRIVLCRYADNILYAYAKPSSIVVTTVLSCMLAGTMPSLSLIAGVSIVVGSIFLYSSKPKPKAD